MNLLKLDASSDVLSWLQVLYFNIQKIIQNFHALFTKFAQVTIGNKQLQYLQVVHRLFKICCTVRQFGPMNRQLPYDKSQNSPITILWSCKNIMIHVTLTYNLGPYSGWNMVQRKWIPSSKHSGLIKSKKKVNRHWVIKKNERPSTRSIHVRA